MKKAKKIPLSLFVLIALILVIQFIPVSRDNPEVLGDFGGPPDAKRIFRNSCYDCHSNETSWPWYSKVAPVSWLIAHDVNEAREHLNFSEWKSMLPEDQLFVKKEIWEEVEHGDMPLGRYVLLHSDARLSEGDKSVIRGWATGLPSTVDSAASNAPY